MRLLLIAVLVLGLSAAALAADTPVKVFINGKLQSYTPSAMLRAGTVYVPLRAGAESLGLHVEWHADMKAAQVCSDAGCVLIREKEGINVKGSLLLPLRKMGEVTGAKFVWDGPRKSVFVKQ